MSVHGYPADKSIFLLQLEIRLTEVTKRQLAVWRVSCWCAARCRTLVAQYVACSPFLGNNTRFLVSGCHRVSNLPASRDAAFAAVQIGF